MKKTLSVLFLLLLLCSGTLFAEGGIKDSANGTSSDITTNTMTTSELTTSVSDPLQITTPAENAHLPAVPSTFVCGSAPPEGKLWINGTPVPIHPGGGFLTMVKLSSGEFQIIAELQLGDVRFRYTRNIVVAGSAPISLALPAGPVSIGIEDVSPKQDQELLPGDFVEVTCKGTSGKKAYFTLKEVNKEFPLIETDANSGVYRGVYQIGDNDKVNKSKFKVTLEENGKKCTMESAGTISRFPENIPAMVETTSPDVILRAGPAVAPDDKAGYFLFPSLGTIMQITGRKGDEYRVRLTKTKTVWVSANQVQRLPEGTLPNYVMAGNISISAGDRSTRIRLPLGRRIPFMVEPDPDGKYIDISFYGAFSNTDLITNVTNGVTKHVSWFQDDQETYRLRVNTVPNSWWGYDPRYEGTDFVLELRTPPPMLATSSSLMGLKVALDAGHGIPDNGAIGATGYLERDANLALALNLKEKLLAKGADVFMIRTDNTDVPLSDRPKIAWQNKADILISVHNNSLPYGGNPFIKHGFGVYYFTPMSMQLAKEVHTAYCQRFENASDFNLRDDGLYYDNLALTRSPQMPSILTESAYMIVPEEEAYLKDDNFRSACAEAIVNGIEQYAGSMRPLFKSDSIQSKVKNNKKE